MPGRQIARAMRRHCSLAAGQCRISDARKLLSGAAEAGAAASCRTSSACSLSWGSTPRLAPSVRAGLRQTESGCAVSAPKKPALPCQTRTIWGLVRRLLCEVGKGTWCLGGVWRCAIDCAVPCGLMVRMPGFHLGAPGSIPGMGKSFCVDFVSLAGKLAGGPFWNVSW